MTDFVSKESVYAFYVNAIGQGSNTTEQLQAPISARFNAFLKLIEETTPRTALDLGYGVGNYSIALAQAGYSVVSVDQIPSLIFARRIYGQGNWVHRIEIIESLVENYSIDREFGIVIAKDVLHYLARPDIEAVLGNAISSASFDSHHYLEVFTSIIRKSANGEPCQIEGEADYSTESFQQLINQLYRGWEVNWYWEEHAEQDNRTGKNCFEAIRATVIATNMTGK